MRCASSCCVNPTERLPGLRRRRAGADPEPRRCVWRLAARGQGNAARPSFLLPCGSADAPARHRTHRSVSSERRAPHGSSAKARRSLGNADAVPQRRWQHQRHTTAWDGRRRPARGRVHGPLSQLELQQKMLLLPSAGCFAGREPHPQGATAQHQRRSAGVDVSIADTSHTRPSPPLTLRLLGLLRADGCCSLSAVLAP
jgi:hypothetical protein